MITWPNSLKCAFYQFSKPMSRKKIFSTTFLIFDSNYKNEFRLGALARHFQMKTIFISLFIFKTKFILKKFLRPVKTYSII